MKTLNKVVVAAGFSALALMAGAHSAQAGDNYVVVAAAGVVGKCGSGGGLCFASAG